jgi:myxalamid-type nonribosomal peptide synthetase MxaA
MTSALRAPASAVTLSDPCVSMPKCTASHLLQRVFELTGEVDVEVLQESLGEVIGNQEMLRTGFVEVEGQAHCVRKDQGWCLVTVQDVRRLLPGQREQEIERVVKREARQGFELSVAPLMRVSVLRCEPKRYVVVVTVHQLVADAGSLRVLMRQWLEAYGHEVRVRGGGGAVGEPVRCVPCGYQQYVQEERQWQQSEGAQEELEYWRAQLQGVPVLQLAGDRVRPAVKAGGLHGAHTRMSWRGAWVSELGRLCAPAALLQGRGEGGGSECRISATEGAVGEEDRFVGVLAGVQALLSRYSGQGDFAVGCVLEGREGRYAELIGPLENTVVVRAQLRGDPDFGQLCWRVKRTWEAARAHGRIGLGRVIEAVQPRADVAHSPLFQVQLVWEPQPPAQGYEAGGVRWRELPVQTGIAAFDLTLRGSSAGEELHLQAEYSTEVFEAHTVQRLLKHLGVLLQAGVGEGRSLKVSELPLMDEQERTRLLREWNCTEGAYPRERCLHELVQEQARRTPHAVAVVDAERRLSYQQLEEQANALAGHLQQLGVRAESVVGVLSERTAATIVALLGVLKAGGAYVPLDPEHPAQRLRYMLEDAGIQVVIGRAGRLQELSLPGCHGVDVNQHWPPRAQAPPVRVHPLNLAYLIYTSGSTGKPKGVLVAHRQIVNSTVARWRLLPDRISSYAMLAPLTFDASGAGIYWTLCTGGCLVFPRDEDVKDARQLARLIRNHEVSHFDGVASQYATLLDSQESSLSSVRCCILAGETLPLPLVGRHFAACPTAQLVNEYGPTEGTVWSTAYLCEEQEQRATVPIGRPIQNVRVHVLDEYLRPQPTGVPGELYIAGEGLARGYLNEPALTAERFIPNPHALVPGERLYRTGDRARYLSDGNLEFLGRVDTQVKVHGFRVELGEVEAALQEHPGVSAAAVLAREERPGDVRLTAYVVARAGTAGAGTQELVRHLHERLPSYMVPARFVFLDALPLNPSGKLDRTALSEPAACGDCVH